MVSLKKQLVAFKNKNSLFLLIWHQLLLFRGLINSSIYSDTKAINKLYKDFSGKYPNLNNPSTFSEKQQWMKLHHRDPLMTKCADKYKVREYVTDCGYAETLTDLIGYYTAVNQISFDSLPQKFAMKASHGSGWNLICRDKSRINWSLWKRIIGVWLKNNIYWPGREWPYKNVPPGIIIEEYLENHNNDLIDYKFFCFNGDVKFVQVNLGRDTLDHAQNFYDLSWNLLPFGKDFSPRTDIVIEKPKKLEKMIQMAKKLSHPFPFVRIDLYEVEEKVIFGEITFYPKSGLPDFIPAEYDSIIGNYLTLNIEH